MSQPQFGTTRGDVASWFAHYGPQRAREILQGLKANEVRFVQGNSLAVRKVAQGEADICLADTDDIHVAQRNGWPVAMVALDQGGAGGLAIPNSVALVRGGPPRVAARQVAPRQRAGDQARPQQQGGPGRHYGPCFATHQRKISPTADIAGAICSATLA